MTDALGRAIFRVLDGDGVIDALLARSVLEPAAAAIYTTIPVPHDARLPYIVAYMGDVFSVNEDILNAADGGYRRVARDISVYAARPDHGGGDAELVQTVAERIRALFHRQAVEIEPIEGVQRNLYAQASGPIVNDGEQAFGRVVTVTFLVAEPIGV